MKKLLGLAMAVVLAFALFACSAQPAATSQLVESGQQNTLTPGETTTDGSQIALLSTESVRESSFGQAVWASISKFSGEEGISCGSFTINPDDVNAALATIELAAKGGAELVLAIGEDIVPIVNAAGLQHPGIQFVLVGNTPSSETQESQLQFAAAQAGWLVGYAAVAGGLWELAYLQTEDIAVTEYTLGFILGAEYAAAMLGAEDAYGEVPLVRIVAFPLAPEEELSLLRQEMEQLYNSGVELLFWPTALLRENAVRIAANLGGQIAPLDTEESQRTQTAANLLHNPGPAVYRYLALWQQEGISSKTYGLECNTYLLEINTMGSFDEAALEAVLQQLLDGEIGKSINELVADWQQGMKFPELEYVQLFSALDI